MTSPDPTCVNCGHPYSAHTQSMKGCSAIMSFSTSDSKGCPCAEFFFPTVDDGVVVEVDRALLTEVHARLESDWRNASLTRRVNELLNPLPEETELRWKLRDIIRNGPTPTEAADSVIETVFEALLRMPAPQARTSVPAQIDYFYLGADAQRNAFLNFLNPERGIGD